MTPPPEQPPVARPLGPLDSVLLRGVRVLGQGATDVRIDSGRIAAMGPGADDGTAARRVDVSGLVMLPAFVDLHTHLREPGGEDSETIASGTRAAAAGGYSDVFAMANCRPVTDTPRRVESITDLAGRVGACRVHPVGAVTTGLRGQSLAPIGGMARAGARLFSDDGRCVDDPQLLREALLASREAGTVIAQHAQCPRLAGDGQINAGPVADHTGLPPWPAVAEETIAARDVVLAAETGSPLHICHVSTAGTVAVVRWAKQQGWPVTAEVAPHHLMLTDRSAAEADPLYKVNPPLRSAADVTALRAALADGTLDAVATDHAPHPAHRKANDWCHAPFGMLGLETALSVVAEVLVTSGGGPDWARIAGVMSHQPARIGGITALAGRPLRAGEPATFTLIDPEADWRVDTGELHSLSTNTPFASMTFRNRVVATAVGGRLTHDRIDLLPLTAEKEPRR
ncbi:dihydroorotase [Streptomyces sp. NRRL F-4489]|uniref:dihydroorotase n=1 Tax=Streptomyces sp. NRRL F-4489 TaxID=1609095 RepID=UPI00074AB56E|nr:dihydroorotase [Streptomyces sp. NRRL F-4489]KUL55367.1 dihydroorotase [Streptomyces sp. NRRL F-4489]